MDLTKQDVDELEPRAKEYTIWDDRVRGFGVRVKPSGVKTFILKYSRRGRQGKVSLGRYPDLTLAQGRKEAEKARGRLAAGEDPAALERTARQAMTFDAAAKQFLEEHGPRLMQRTFKEYERYVNQVLKPFFKGQKPGEITPADVARLHHGLRETPRKANLVLAVLSKMMSCCEEWGERPLGSNPCQHRQRYPEMKRQRYLSDEEAHALGAVLVDEEAAHPHEVAAIRLALLTGARKGEVQALRWGQIDLDLAVIRLGASEHKTGKKAGAKTIPLGEPAVDLLRELAKGKLSTWVFPATDGHHLGSNLDKVWQLVRKAAGIEDMHFHDLRHSFGATATGLGESERITGAILGHLHGSTTRRYAHVAEHPAQAAANRTATAIADKLKGA